MDARKQRRLLRRAKRFIYREWIWITLGIIFTRFAVEYAYQERGYMAYGGEWLVLPIVLLAVKLARDVIYRDIWCV